MKAELREKMLKVLSSSKSLVFGQDDMLEAILTALVCEGHVLIEGMPGLGKTMSVSVMARLCHLQFQRVQFTPDLLPSDLVGTLVYNQAKQEFSTKFGPIFSQLVLADEINRSPAKVQSALLEAMAEKQVTIGDKTHKLPTPFVVLATQNPIEQEGTYQLPEAQLDRFMMKVQVGYPSYEAERSILQLKHEKMELAPVITQEEIVATKQVVDGIYADEKIKDVIVRIVHATRPDNKLFQKKWEGAIAAGASPRASIWLWKIAKFKAFMANADFVTPDHVMAAVPDVLAHRVMATYEANLDKINMRTVVKDIALATL